MTDVKLAIEVYQRIRSLIVDGTFQPGHRLVEGDLVAALGAGRSYVREALSRLQYDGLLEKESGKSSVVRYVPKAELVEILDARIALEAIVARAAATSRSAQQAARLRELLAALEKSAAAADLAGVTATQAAFHHAVLDASGLPAVRRMIGTLTALSAQTRSRTMLLPGRIAASVRDHRAIAEALIAGDPESAERAMVNHLRSVKEAILQLPHPQFHGGRRPSDQLKNGRPA